VTEPGAPSRCDVCLSEFEPAPGQRRCSEACREFARSHKRVHAADLPKAWEKAVRAETRAREQREAQAAERARPGPSGKVRHHRKRDAVKSARYAVQMRYPDWPDWLRVYQCEKCGSWHLTSKPARIENIVSAVGEQ
jgi:hypothetical protein